MSNRICFYIPIDQFNEHGFIPSVVTENEAGHSPCTGKGDFAQPWYWGDTYEKACEIAKESNARLGLTEADVDGIIASSITAQFHDEAPVRATAERLEKLGLGHSPGALAQRDRILRTKNA